MEADSHDSEVTSATNRLARPTNGFSPTKSSSTSDEEGQVEEKNGVHRSQSGASISEQSKGNPVTAAQSLSSSSAAAAAPAAPGPGPQAANAPAGPSSSAAAAAAASSGSSDRLRDRSPQAVRPSEYWRQDSGEGSSYGGPAPRVRGYDGNDQSAIGPPRWPSSTREDRRPYYEGADSRRRLSPQAYDRYDPSNRSLSIGSHDDRYRDPQRYSPTARRYDDRDREWERERETWDRASDRERERLRWQRERDWEQQERERDRDRDREWSRGPHHGRLSSPSRSTQAAASEVPPPRAYSGTWSGPTSPSSTRRDRYSLGSNWERDRFDRERYERERDRERERERLPSTGWRHSIASDEAYPSRPPHSRSPPRRETTPQWSANRASVSQVQQQSNASSSTPIALRSPEEHIKERPRNTEPIVVPATPERPARPAKPALKEEPAIDQPAAPTVQPETMANAREETTKDEEEDASEQAMENAAAEDTKDNTENTLKETMPANVPDQLVVAEQTTTEVKVDLSSDDTIMVSTTVDTVAPLAVVDQEDATVDVVPEPIEAAAESSDIELPAILPEISADTIDTTGGQEVRKTMESEGSMPLDAEKVAAMPDVETKAEDAPSDVISKSLRDSQAMKSVGADEVLMEALAEEVADAAEQRRSPMNLQLETVKLMSDDPPLPTPRTKEEQERVKRASLQQLLIGQRTNDYEVAKVIHDNRKLVKIRSLKPLESAIHGELPRKDHVEPWLDDEDEAVLSMRSKMMKYASARQKRLKDKMESLRTKYKQLNADWQRHCARLDRMSEARDSYAAANNGGGGSSFNQGVGSAGGLASSMQQSEESSATLASALSSSLTRANRRNTQTGFAGFGDAVRSEAEFLEILASLENADMQDPNMRAARTTATEPEMIINPDQKLLLNEYDDDNGFVADPVAFYCSNFDPDFWTDEEKTTFVRRYALFPKQFGKIAASLPHKTAKQCVAYYYLTKHAGADYKSLSAARNRDRKRKSRVKPKKGRGSALMADLKGDDVEEEETQSPGETSTDVAPTSGAARKGGASSRARMLTTSTGSGGGDLAAVAEDVGEEESTDVSVGGARKRRGDELPADDNAKRGAGGKAKRSRLEKKARNNAAAGAEGQPAAALQQADLDLAAAEALGALAGGMMSSLGDTGGDPAGSGNAGRRKKSATASGTTKQPMQSPARMDAVNVEDGAKRSRQTTSSYWSVAERNEFLRSLATFEKDWDAIAATLSTKSAAQARNYYARNVDEIEFVEAVALAKENAALSLAERQEQANVFIQKRAVAVTPNERSGAAPPSGYFATPAARGLNINSLLNTEDATSSGQSTRRASYNEWFHKDQRGDDSNDDTEDEDAREGANGEREHHEDERDMDRVQERYNHHRHQYDPHQRQPPPPPPAAARHEYEPGDYFEGASRSSHHSADYSSAPTPRYLMGQMQHHHRQAPSMLSSMPPPSAFLSASSRYQLPGQQQRIGSDGQRSPLPYQHGASDAYSQHRYAFERDPSGGGNAPHRAWSPPSSGPTPPLLETQRHSSWPNAQSPAHLGPSSSSQLQPHSVGRGDSASTSSLSPYGGPPRPSSASGAGFSSLHHLSSARSPYERPHSSNGPISSIRSLSPHPPPSLHQQQQQQHHQQQQQQHLQPPRLPPINQSLFSPRRHSDEGPPQ